MAREALFSISLIRPSKRDIEVSYKTVAVTALPGVHYVDTAGGVILYAGEMEKQVAVPLIDTTLTEDVIFKLRLTKASAGGIRKREQLVYLEANDPGGPDPGEFESISFDADWATISGVDESGTRQGGSMYVDTGGGYSAFAGSGGFEIAPNVWAALWLTANHPGSSSGFIQLAFYDQQNAYQYWLATGTPDLDNWWASRNMNEVFVLTDPNGNKYHLPMDTSYGDVGTTRYAQAANGIAPWETDVVGTWTFSISTKEALGL